MNKQINSAIAISSALLLILSFLNSCIQEDTFSNATVETSKITSITTATANCGGTIKSDGGSHVTSRGVCWSTNQIPTTTNSKTMDGSGRGNFTSTLTGLTPSTTYYVRSYATNNVGTSYGNEVSFTCLETSGTVTDIEGNVYNYITIGTQRWMTENLKTTKFNDGTSIPLVIGESAWANLTTPGYCFYNNDTSYKNTYGALYNWYTVNTGKLAPTDWHVPTDAEWSTLENYLIANGYNYDGSTTGNKIAKSLAASTGWSTSIKEGAIGNNLSKNNTSGFAGLPGGFRYYYGELFNSIGRESFWWSSSEESYMNFPEKLGGIRYLVKDSSSVYSWHIVKQYGYSVRCVLD